MQQPKMTRDLLEHRQALLGFLFAFTRNFEAAEEIFQETALAILDEAAAGKQVEPFLPWAREVARRRAAEYLRESRNRKSMPLPDSMLDALARSFDENDESKEETRARQKHLAKCLETLTDRVRRMLNLRYHSNKNVAEIARDAGWTVDAVHVALSRSRKTLAECIARRISDGGAAI
ncbi:MAG TPA: sigma-70 family RNA polymerase sigma factor [Planctomycetota bacterium]|nr:sigma-70 family RNA polymerase sigma factor [Planctomycetota bacterium]